MFTKTKLIYASLLAAISAAAVALAEAAYQHLTSHMQRTGLIVMAKTNGPLFSMDASGKFAGALVFTKWKGRPVVRQLVIPANPNSADQETQRNMVRVAGAGQRWTNMTALILDGETEVDKARLITAAPPGQAWNGYLVKSMIGAGSVNYDAATAQYAGALAANHAAWDTAAEALVPAFPEVAQTEVGGTPITPMTTGAVFHHYIYGLYVAGLSDIPAAVPPVYA